MVYNIYFTAAVINSVEDPDENFFVELVLGTGDIAQAVSNKLANSESSVVFDVLDQPKIYYGMGVNGNGNTISMSGSSIVNIDNTNCNSVR